MNTVALRSAERDTQRSAARELQGKQQTQVGNRLWMDEGSAWACPSVLNRMMLFLRASLEEYHRVWGVDALCC